MAGTMDSKHSDEKPTADIEQINTVTTFDQAALEPYGPSGILHTNTSSS
jgi:hypothetical protein